MFRVADWPIRRKLSLLTTCGALVALLLACLAFASHDVRRIRAAKAQQIAALADILGSNATTAIEFCQADVAAEVLSSLRLQPSIELAVLFDAEGEMLATYPDELPADHPILANPHDTDAAHVDNGYMAIVQDIRRDGDRVGSIYLVSNLKEIDRQLGQTVWILLGVMVAALGISMLITGRLQQFFTAPIHELAGVMRHIAAGGDYSRHVTKHGRDELGVLCDGFNVMLDRIKAARDELQHAHDQLEKRVVERTVELQVALQAAQAASRAKSNFLANMSHEIRTPMTAILGYADILAEEEGLSDDAREKVAAMGRSGNHLLAIINDILDISKIEAGKMTVERIGCSPCQVVGDVASLMRSRAVEKGLTLDVAFGGRIPETICSDPTRVRQVLVNLIGNAIKFTNHGGIRLAVSMAEPAGDGDSHLCFEITDTGVGMSRQQLDRVFRAFTQADETMTRRFGGTGLGLTISKALAETLGGTLSVESTPGKGSTFRFAIETGPLDGVHMLENCTEAHVSSARQPADKEDQAPLRLSSRVLLCEDGADNQRVIAFLLEKAGVEVTVADNGQIGLEMALEARAAGRPFDLILMDMQMPVLDGYNATRRLREEGYRGPIVALTAHAMAHDRQKCLEAGCDDYASKPINRGKVLEIVRKHVSADAPADVATTDV